MTYYCPKALCYISNLKIMIPKTIHYCWFSGEEKPDTVKKCIQSWKSVLNDYEFIEWNLKTFDKNIIPFVAQAVSEKKWAFAADYFRLWVLYNYGGIYLDCDVIINQKLDRFLENELFLGWEDIDVLEAHLMGSDSGHAFIKECMLFYENTNFKELDGSLFLVPMPSIITKIALDKFGLKRNYKTQMLKNKAVIYTAEYFSIKYKNRNNYAEHLFLGSWNDNRESNYYGVLMLKHNKFNNNLKRTAYFLKRYIRERFQKLSNTFN